MAPAACQVVLPVAVSPVMVSLAVGRQAAWHLAICNSKVCRVVTAVTWAHTRWAKTRCISRDSRASRARCPVVVRIINSLPARVLKDQVPWARILQGHKGNPALRVRPPCTHSAGANLDSVVDQKEEG